MKRRYMAVGLAIPTNPTKPLGKDFVVIELGSARQIQDRIPIAYADVFYRACVGDRLRVSLYHKPIGVWTRRARRGRRVAKGIRRDPVVIRVAAVVRTPEKEAR